MKKLTSLVFATVLCVGSMSAWAEGENASDVFRDIEVELGFVPEFFFQIPERTLRDHWNLFKDMFLRENGPLSSKEKELIGIAVAGMKSCDYCLYLHHALARLHGATEEEINEVAQVSRSVAHWSTFLYSINYPLEQFEKEVDKIVRGAQ